MELLFTRHAVLRMRERAISEVEVYELFEGPMLALARKERVVIGRTRRGRFLTLVLDLQGKRLLTLWPSSRAQRKLFQEREGSDEKENA